MLSLVPLLGILWLVKLIAHILCWDPAEAAHHPGKGHVEEGLLSISHLPRLHKWQTVWRTSLYQTHPEKIREYICTRIYELK